MTTDGICDSEWEDKIHKIRSHSPTYLERVYLYKKLTKNIKGLVLDDGCGADFDKLALLPRNIKYIGVDASELVVNKLKKAKYNVKLMDATDLKFRENTFDYILSFSVLEHIEDDLKYLIEAHRVLKPNGHLLLNVPLRQRHWSPLDDRLGHKRRYETKCILFLLKKVGFRVQKKYWGITLFNYLFRLYANRKSRMQREQFMPVEKSRHIILLDLLRPLFSIDKLFNCFGFWGLNIYIIAKK